MDDSFTNEMRTRSRFFYGWVIAAVGAVLIALNSSIINGFGVFFKPLAADFGWSRADTSIAHSISLVCNGTFAIVMGWLADRFGPSRVLVGCGILLGMGLVLTSQIHALWQIYLTYGLITGIGLSGAFTLVTATTVRWFVKRRGLALGIASSGIGIGTVVVIPILALLISNFGWSRTYFIMGLAACMIMVAGAGFLRSSPESMGLRPYGSEAALTPPGPGNSPESAVSVSTALHTSTLWLMFGIFFLFTFCGQMIMVHLVNYATDVGITPLVAATLVSAVGLANAIGRLSLGAASDRIGSINVLIVSCMGFAVSLLWLMLARELWMLYLFAIVFGLSLGGEVPQQSTLIRQFFGLRMALVGSLHASSTAGAALGTWMAGQVFDITGSYQMAFLIGVGAVAVALAATLLLRKRRPHPTLVA